ncbi:MAG: T9SS type A sorting domain-containing protein [Bacteroidia bacterium]|nr:T9SS type A sorting domain-containing protein [Bacteroidia bacterium]
MKKLITCCIVLIGFYSQIAFGQQSIDAYITDSTKNNFIVVASSTNSLVSPIDLDFYPDQSKRPNELWILNQGTNSTGGSTQIVSKANQSTRTYKYVKDGNAWHFMAMASAMAFGDSNWATSQDIVDANRQGGTYTGPTLWPGNLSVYGIVGNPSTPTENGSHLSMIHQTPYGKGIAFERNNVYWVLDGYEGNIKRYDFGNPHEPGGADHSGGGVQVYPDFKFTKHATLPSHIVIDGNRKYLYGCDPVGKRIFRIDITTGTNNGNRTKINGENLSLGYVTYTGLTKVDSLITGLNTPVGIDVYGNRLIITDNGSDEIIIYDITNNYKEIGRIKLNYATNPDPMGVKVGPDGKIYFVDKTNRRAYMIDNSSVLPTGITPILETNNTLHLFPNPANSQISIQANAEMKNAQIVVLNSIGEIVLNQSTENANSLTLDISALNNGIYFIQVQANNKLYKQKFLKQ